MADAPSGILGPQGIFSYLTSHGYSPVQAAALVGNMQQESSFNPTEYNQKEGAYGLIQWRNDRLDALKSFAKSTGRDISDPTAQLDFIGQEMRGPESKSAGAFLSANDLPSANAALKNYIRYGDNSQATRLKYASNMLGAPPNPNGDQILGTQPQPIQQAQVAAPSPQPQQQPQQQAQQQPLPAFAGAMPMQQQAQMSPEMQALMPILNAPIRMPQRNFNLAQALQKIPVPAGFKGYS